MLSDKEINSIVELSQFSTNNSWDCLINAYLCSVKKKNPKEKVIEWLCDLQGYMIALNQSSLKDMFLQGYKKGYEDALLKSSGLNNIVLKDIN